MPGDWITDRQCRRYMERRRLGDTQVVAAARAGISERSARRLQRQCQIKVARLALDCPAVTQHLIVTDDGVRAQRVFKLAQVLRGSSSLAQVRHVVDPAIGCSRQHFHNLPSSPGRRGFLLPVGAPQSTPRGMGATVIACYLFC